MWNTLSTTYDSTPTPNMLQEIRVQSAFIGAPCHLAEEFSTIDSYTVMVKLERVVAKRAFMNRILAEYMANKQKSWQKIDDCIFISPQ